MPIPDSSLPIPQQQVQQQVMGPGSVPGTGVKTSLTHLPSIPESTELTERDVAQLYYKKNVDGADVAFCPVDVAERDIGNAVGFVRQY